MRIVVRSLGLGRPKLCKFREFVKPMVRFTKVAIKEVVVFFEHFLTQKATNDRISKHVEISN